MTSPTRVKLTFPEHLIKQPMIARLVQEFNVMPNIRQAKIEEHVGWVVCELAGDAADIEPLDRVAPGARASRSTASVTSSRAEPSGTAIAAFRSFDVGDDWSVRLIDVHSPLVPSAIDR